ncbi:hypothetical protein SARC_01702 [Sphaeroforma arctica JP610]|uniref:Uncharacterized protein n=1 Tax=Sphaeroforma arctica JP610 TaxID=667725 RepID=A0A0L0GD26_9EUKA|nr:hypothetical protein SARC_01702 [Sphaeroforma arctica JP610]KNC86133.1 hypothetical protein SARC_01702 [Sphaeroforma arctica JP610]|eukprot:XP_014160035.1 hypothetical protein SARC_01702 [Sphaeroforma arctica JP610]
MMAHALPKEIFDDVTMCKPHKSKKSKKPKEKKGKRNPKKGSAEDQPEPPESKSESPTPKGRRFTDDYMRELRQLAAAFKEYKDQKNTGKRKFTVEMKSKSSSGDESRTSPEFEESDSSGPDNQPPSAKRSKTSTRRR